MSDTPDTPVGREDMMSALFANMVLQQANMALMFLGKVPHPQTGQHMVELDTARIFIDQLEMLEAKTKGNLTKTEEAILKQNLTGLRMAFVEAANANPAGESPKTAGATAAGPTPDTASAASSETPAAESELESRKKFTKKY